MSILRMPSRALATASLVVACRTPAPPTPAPAAVSAPATPAAAKSTTATPTASASAAAKPGVTYKVKKGDTLVTIARNAYGNDKSWQRIYQANKTSISDPNIVPVGLVIKIPQ